MKTIIFFNYPISNETEYINEPKQSFFKIKTKQQNKTYE